NRLTLGFTFVNQQQNNVLVSGGDRLRGMLPYDMPQPTTIWVIVRDETPLDGGGVRVSDLRMKASSADGMSRSVTPRRVIRTKLTEPVRNPISGVISSSAAWSPTVPWLPEFDPEINPSITSQDIKQNRLTQMKVFYRTGVVEAPTGIHEIASDELLVYSFELPTDLGVNETVFEGTFSGDYAVMTAQAHTFSFRGTDGDAFIDQRLAPWVVVARANGNVRDGSNTERIEFRHRLATGQSVTGVNAELHLIGVDLWGEYTWNSLYSQYPTSAGKTHVEHRRAWYVNALKRFDHVSFGAELFNIDANYGFGNNSRRGGSVLYNDYSSIQTNSNTIKQDLNDPTGDPYLRGQAYQEFKLVDDNDDRDPWPDDAEQDRPNGTHPNRGVSVGSSDINNDGIADFVQPFLLYDSDPVDFVYGEDFNNNSVVDDRENDDHPDYPYSPDQRGWHAFTRFQWAREGFFTLGTIRVDQPMGGGTSNSNYAKFDFRYADPVIGRLQLIHDSKRVRDTIADHLFETDQDPSKAALESIDPWTRNNRIIATDPLFDNL
ncbi:MAG: hypothetical protein QGH20_02790, partial [Candidatus Latescibacteria bacterium]|nr:hypothetical protein [Candidatus Latescibacterota bacterium]